MSEAAPTAPAPSLRQRVARYLRDLPRWKKILLGCATCLAVAGLVLQLVATGSAPGPTDSGTGNAFLDQGPTSGDQSAGGGDAWSAGMFRLGFSFIAGFCVGFATRTFLKLTALGTGIALLLLFALAYLGLIEVQWDAIDHAFETLATRVKDEASRFQSFITGSLPSAGLAGLGIFTGFKRNR